MPANHRTFTSTGLRLAGIATLLLLVFGLFSLRLRSPADMAISLATPREVTQSRLPESMLAARKDALDIPLGRLTCASSGFVHMGFGPLPRTLHPDGTNALYKPASDSLFATHQAPPRSVLHAMVHAAHDQEGVLARVLDPKLPFDERIALLAFTEGAAHTYIQQVIRPGSVRQSTEAYTRFVLGPLAIESVSRMTPREVLTGPVVRPATLHTLLFTDEGFFDPPLPHLGGGEEILCTDRLGIFGLGLALHRHADPAHSVTDLLADWRGDRMTLIQGPVETRVVWDVYFNTAYSVQAWRNGPAVMIPLTQPQVAVSGSLVLR